MYLVRTQAPVHNTTHHVLKHVVVANESMLTEVKKEVDVMVHHPCPISWLLFMLFLRGCLEVIRTLST